MPQDHDQAVLRCPNCRQPMQEQALEQNYLGTVRVELCFACAGIWFDHQGSARLAPGSVIELFKRIQPHLEGERRPVTEPLHCPACDGPLAKVFDLCRNGRFTYYRCQNGDGRYTPFYEFLREKQFVRSLTPAEIQTVRAQVAQVRCSGCGAPLDLEKSSVCAFCHAPVALLDKDAVAKAVQMWSEADKQRKAPVDTEAIADALLGAHLPKAPSQPGQNFTVVGMADAAGSAELGVDLVAAGMRLLGELLN